MPRRASHETDEGRRWYRQLRNAQAKVETAERERDELALRALDARELSTHSVASALKIDAATAWRRYVQDRRKDAA